VASVFSTHQRLRRKHQVPPLTSEQYEQADVENLLVESLERLADVITTLLPEGMEEFQSYLTKAVYHSAIEEWQAIGPQNTMWRNIMLAKRATKSSMPL